VIVVVQKAAEQHLTDFIRMYSDSYVDRVDIDLVTIQGETLGSADALRMIRHKLKSDFLVVSGDLITDVTIHYLADYHRINDSAVTMLLSKQPPAKEAPKKGGGKGKGKKGGEVKEEKDDNEPSPLEDTGDVDRYYISVVKRENRLLYFRSSADVEYNHIMRFSKSMLRQVGSLTVQSDLKDAQFCIFSRWVLDVLEMHENISSIQGELIPFLVEKQFESDLGDMSKFVV
jgi:translation initiation factor eIF-2B subunit gamma